MAKQKIGARIKIILVDDDREMSEPLKVRLQKEGYDVSLATSGKALPERCGRIRPQLIILDLNLPQRSGFLALEDLKADVSTESIPVLVLTVRSETTSWERCYGSGAAAYFVKPFNSGELLKRIKKLTR